MHPPRAPAHSPLLGLQPLAWATPLRMRSCCGGAPRMRRAPLCLLRPHQTAPCWRRWAAAWQRFGRVAWQPATAGYCLNASFDECSGRYSLNPRLRSCLLGSWQCALANVLLPYCRRCKRWACWETLPRWRSGPQSTCAKVGGDRHSARGSLAAAAAAAAGSAWRHLLAPPADALRCAIPRLKAKQQELM